MDEPITTRILPNAELLPFIVAQLEETPGKTVTLPLRGRSMRPFLEDGRDMALLTLCNDPRPGDAVLAEIAPRCYVLHRIVAIDGNAVTLRGDGNLGVEHCRVCDVKARALGFFRKGRKQADLTSGIKWRVYSWLWCRLLPVRRYLLFALHPHWPRRFSVGK